MSTPTLVNPKDLVGVHEIATRFKVTDTAVWQWRKRKHCGFPAPILTLKCGPIFSLTAVKEWRKKGWKAKP